MMTDPAYLKALLPYFLLVGGLTAYLAHTKRGRKPIPWFFLGFSFGLLALVTLFFLPKKDNLSSEPSLTPKEPVLKELPMTHLVWYFLDEHHKQQGPISFFFLKEKYAKGTLDKESYVWNESLEEWKQVETLPDYFSKENPQTT